MEVFHQYILINFLQIIDIVGDTEGNFQFQDIDPNNLTITYTRHEKLIQKKSTTSGCWYEVNRCFSVTGAHTFTVSPLELFSNCIY